MGRTGKKIIARLLKYVELRAKQKLRGAFAGQQQHVYVDFQTLLVELPSQLPLSRAHSQ